jgi:uncharacterized protein (DUF305 family)|tara:strand:- start:477 stop:1121 length:645 start_codon:yes stop_codon:yes gene_type:complete
MSIKNKIIIIFFILSIIYILTNSNEQFSKSKNICTGYLTDNEYLEHMIPHHQVAIDISIMLQKVTKSPIMLEILRKVIFNQKMEIIMMQEMKNKLPNNISNIKDGDKRYMPTISDLMKPNKLGLTRTYCNPHFFHPKEHMKHMKHIKLNDEIYIKHMVPHHQVAVDMSKVLLKNTNSDFMRYLGYRIIRSQQAETILLTDLLNKSEYYFNSELL